MRAIVVFWALISAGTTLAACTDSGARPGIQISMKEMHFTPSSISVVAGRYSVIARNSGKLTHTLSFNQLGQEVTVTPGKTRSFAVNLAPGTYRYVCRILDHEGLGMRGVLHVRSK